MDPTLVDALNSALTTAQADTTAANALRQQLSDAQGKVSTDQVALAGAVKGIEDALNAIRQSFGLA